MTDQETLKTLFTYYPNHGVCIDRFGNLIGARSQGRINYHYKGKLYPLTRLIWIYMTGSIDETKVVDHHNAVIVDNRWCNLTLMTQKQNMQKRSPVFRYTLPEVHVPYIRLTKEEETVKRRRSLRKASTLKRQASTERATHSTYTPRPYKLTKEEETIKRRRNLKRQLRKHSP